MAKLRIVIPMDVADETVAKAMVESLEAQFPASIVKAFYEAGVDTSAAREAAAAKAVADANAELVAVADVIDDPRVVAAIAAARAAKQIEP